MGAAYFVVLEQSIPGLDVSMDGKGLAREIEELDKAAQRLGVRELSAFVSVDPEDIASLLQEEGGQEGNLDLVPRPAQFSADAGLTTVRALLTDRANDDVARDLRDCERVLVAASSHGVRWHFEVDI